MGKSQSGIKERIRSDIKEPHRYKVIMFNDDFTTMDFVVKVLCEVFYKSASEAETIMMTIHRTGQCVVGIYTLDMARSKCSKAMTMAHLSNFPLRVIYRPE